MSKIKQASVIECSVSGVGFRMRRRSTLVMAEAKGIMAVAGQIAGASAAAEPSEQQAAEFIKAVLSVALLDCSEGDGWFPVFERYTIEDLAPFTDALFTKFLASGLSVDPTPPSCEA